LPTPEHREVAELLLEKARGDPAAAELLAADERHLNVAQLCAGMRRIIAPLR
jgi:hypothetical protein